jgi:hypothetical protein
MKYILFLFLFLFFFGCIGFQVPDEQLNKEKIIYCDTLNQKQIYQKSLQWIAGSFRSAKAVIEYQNEQEGKIIGNISIPYSFGMLTLYARGSMTITAKENKVKINFIIKDKLVDGSPAPIFEGDWETIQIKINSMIENYQNLILLNRDDKW